MEGCLYWFWSLKRFGHSRILTLSQPKCHHSSFSVIHFPINVLSFTREFWHGYEINLCYNSEICTIRFYGWFSAILLCKYKGFFRVAMEAFSVTRIECLMTWTFHFLYEFQDGWRGARINEATPNIELLQSLLPSHSHMWLQSICFSGHFNTND